LGEHMFVRSLEQGSPSISSALTDISCPSPTSCVAVGLGGPIERWTGRAWITLHPHQVRGQYAPNAVSCLAVNWCMTVGTVKGKGGAVIQLSDRWNGSRWSLEPVPGLPNGKGLSLAFLQSVSCPTLKTCIAGGQSELPPPNSPILAERWNGVRWSAQRVPSIVGTGFTGALESISCPVASMCLGAPPAPPQRLDLDNGSQHRSTRQRSLVHLHKTLHRSSNHFINGRNERCDLC
jgi:hypothetical protein